MNTQMTIGRRQSYVEVLEILKYMDKKYIGKIPQELIDFFEENKDTNYEFVYDQTLEMNKQKLKDNTLAVLAMLNLNYWCESKEHKEELLNKYKNNEIIYQEELREKYNPDDIFKKKGQEKEEQETQSEEKRIVVIQKPKWYKKILNIIKELFERK